MASDKQSTGAMAKERKSVIANTNASKTREQKSPKANTKVKPKAKRTNKPKHVCEFIDPNGAACSQEFGRQGNLKRHIREKHTGYVYSCGKAACNFWSANQSRVSDHKSSGHKLRTGQLDPDTKATLKPCDECSNHFRSEHFYNRHIEMGECVSLSILTSFAVLPDLFSFKSDCLYTIFLSYFNCEAYAKEQRFEQ